jgi:cyanate lyase
MIPRRSRDVSSSELRNKLRSLREQRGLSARALGEKAGFSQAKISKIENGQRLAKPEDVRRILEILEVRSDLVESLVGQAAAVHGSRRHPMPAGDSCMTDFHHIGELMMVAREQVVAENVDLPMWVQTPAYIEQVHRSYRIPVPLREFITVKLERSRTTESVRRKHVAVITEEVLYRPILPVAQWAEQLLKVEERLSRPGVELGILPEGAPCEAFFKWHGFDGEYVLTEGMLGGRGMLTSDRAAVREHMDQFERSAELAVWGGAAIKLIRSAIARCERSSQPTVVTVP